MSKEEDHERPGRRYGLTPAGQEEFWNQPAQVDWWGQEYGGIPFLDNAVVRDALNTSGFYDDLNPDSTLLDVAVGAYSYIDVEKLPKGVQMYAVDLSVGMLRKLRKVYPGRYVDYIVSDIAQYTSAR